MPVVGEFHGAYWSASDTSAPVVVTTRTAGYPAWQGSVVLGFGFGGAANLWARWMDAVRWLWRLFRLTRRFDAEQRAALGRAAGALNHSGYPQARLAVRRTATTLGFNRPESWKELSRELKGNANNAENAFRHLEACRLTKLNCISSTLTNPELHLLVELAYQGFAWQGR